MIDDQPPTNLSQEAIDAALSSDWEKAIKLNTKLIKEFSSDVDAFNRLAHAYFEICNYKLARKYYTQALEIDSYNPIAIKNLKILQSFKKINGQKPTLSNLHTKISPSLFLQEPGKTKVISLLKVAEPQKISKAYCGMCVELVCKNRGITVLDENGNYLGVLPDDTAHRLIKLIKGGNKYLAFIKSIRVNGIAILIRETHRAARFKNQPSFLDYYTDSPSPSVIILPNNTEEEVNFEEDQ